MPRTRNGLKPLALLAFVMIALSAGPSRAGDVLKYRVTTLADRAYCYWRFSSAARTIQSGDRIEYDVYLNNNAPGIGGIDVRCTDGTYWRDLGYSDQNGLNGHPAADLSSRAYGKWYHRILPVPAAVVGKTTQRWDVALDGNACGVWECYSAFYDNVRITNGGATVLNVYTDGAPSVNQLDFSNGSPIQSANLLYGATRRAGTQVATNFFYWYGAPSGNADPTQMVYDPRGLSNTGPWSGYGYPTYSGYYSTANSGWWEGELQDMKRAGVDIATLVCWGNHPWPLFQISVLSDYLVPALDRSGVGVKIALFDDTTSECCEWNNDRGRGYTADTPMPLSDPANWVYFYDRKIKPFYQAIPQKYWATHNGLPLEQGGRPIIQTYGSGWFTGVNTHGATMWSTIKTWFARDFKDANGASITPFLIHEASWISQGAGASADSYYGWGAAVSGPNINQIGGYYSCQIGPGFDNRLISSPGIYKDRQRQATLVGWYNGSYGGRRVWDSGIITVETWNELWEGTGINRCVDYPDPWNPGTYLPETFYMDTFRNLVRSSVGLTGHDATFLRTWEIPAYMSANSVTVNVRNDGAVAWEPGTHSLGGRLLSPSTRAVLPGTERVLATVPVQVLGGSECQITFSAPPDWPMGTCLLQLDMMEGATWFSSFGDTPVTKSVTVDLVAPTGSISINSGALYTISRTVTLTLSAVDVGTGVTGMRLVEAGGEFGSWSAYSTSRSWTFASGDGIRTILVQFRDAAGNISPTYSAEIFLDTQSPTAPGRPADSGAFAVGTSVVFTWTPGSDSGSGINSYICQIGRTPGGNDVFDGNVGNVLTTTIAGSYGSRYYCRVRSRDNAGRQSAWSAASDGITVVEHTGVSVGTARPLPRPTSVGLASKPVTAIFSDCFYIEEPDRSAAIKVKPADGLPAGLGIGSLVDVGGAIALGADGELWVDATVSVL